MKGGAEPASLAKTAVMAVLASAGGRLLRLRVLLGAAAVVEEVSGAGRRSALASVLRAIKELKSEGKLASATCNCHGATERDCEILELTEKGRSTAESTLEALLSLGDRSTLEAIIELATRGSLLALTGYFWLATRGGETGHNP